MVLMQLKPAPPEQRKASIAVTVSLSSPTVSIADLKRKPSAKDLSLDLHLRCTSSTSPSQPITISTVDSIFDNSAPEGESHLDTLAQGSVPGGFVNNRDSSRCISLGNFRIGAARNDDRNKSPNMLDRPALKGRFVTIPTKESGDEVVIKHPLSPERLFHYSEKLKLDDIRPGEKYSIEVSPMWIGTMWWCWGAIQEGKKYSAWQKPNGSLLDRAPKPPQNEIDNEEWVLGENPTELWFEIENSGTAELEFVE